MSRSHLVCVSSIFAALALPLSLANDASACGACFAPPQDNTEVSGHRMVLALSQAQTTLYDQITYTGSPSSFAWVLPIRGQVSVGLSAEVMFQTLDADTAHQVSPPPIVCPGPPEGCNPYGYGEGDSAGPTAGSGGAGGAAMDGGVSVITQETVGPYETVQLSSTDPAALDTWLADHGYVVPADVKPVVAAYVAEGFDFLALKLVPGAGVSSMRPVRVTAPGASPTLPLRMVAGGTGANVPITLWVVAEGAYETQNFPTFRIDPSELVWDWASSSSNYDVLRDQGYKASGAEGWLDESSIAFSPYSFTSEISSYVQMGNHDYDPQPDADGGAPSGTAQDALDQDLAVLFAGMSPTSVRVTRLRAQLPRAALGADLTLQAAADQTEVPRSVVAKTALNIPPCPDYSWCATDPLGIAGSAGLQPAKPTSGGLACTASRASSRGGADFVAALAALAAVALSRRGRKKGA